MKRIATLCINEKGTYKSRYFLCDEKYNDGKNEGLYVDFAWGDGINYGNLDDKNFLKNFIKEYLSYSCNPLPCNNIKINEAFNISSSKGLVDAIIYLFDLEEVSLNELINRKWLDVDYSNMNECYLSSGYKKEENNYYNTIDYEDEIEYDDSNDDYTISSNNIYIVRDGLDIDEEFHVDFKAFNTLDDANEYLDALKDGDIGVYNHLSNLNTCTRNYGVSVSLQDIQNLVKKDKKIIILEQEIYLGRDLC